MSTKVGSGDTPPPSRKKKIKLQVPSKARAKGFPKWIPPEKRMRQYRKNVKDSTKIPFINFRIVVPTEDDKRQLQAAFEFIHDGPVMDTEEDYIIINQLAHSYIDDTLEEGAESPILVDSNLFKQVRRETCKHNREHYFYDQMEFCKDCHKCLAVTSYRG